MEILLTILVSGVVILLGVLLGAGVVFASSVWNAFIVFKLWGWFMVPLGLPIISLAHAYGIDVLLTYIVTSRMAIDYVGKEGESNKRRLLRYFVYSAGTLLLGYVAHILHLKGL